jgi:hypothetical protein
MKYKDLEAVEGKSRSWMKLCRGVLIDNALADAKSRLPQIKISAWITGHQILYFSRDHKGNLRSLAFLHPLSAHDSHSTGSKLS